MGKFILKISNFNCALGFILMFIRQVLGTKFIATKIFLYLIPTLDLPKIKMNEKKKSKNRQFENKTVEK